MDGRGESRSVRSTELLSPSNSHDALDGVHCKNRVPLWFATLFPMVPQPFTTVEDDEDDDTTPISTVASDHASISTSLFPTPASVTQFTFVINSSAMVRSSRRHNESMQIWSGHTSQGGALRAHLRLCGD
jgi:hypothetical protein